MLTDKEHIRQLWHFYINDLASPEQVQELYSYLNDPANDDEHVRMYQQVLAGVKAPAGRLSAADVAAAWQSLVERESALQQAMDSPVPRVHSMKPGWLRYAAAILILAASTVVVYLWTNKANRESSIVHNEKNNAPVDIAPGGNKAMLTLSDGTTITLESATNGTIAQQGSADVVKLADGQVEYKLKGNNAGQVLMNTMSTPRGGQYQLTLPDGTKVWLNAASSITYPAVFVGKERNVKITGEAYFEVAKNKEKPFIVDVDGKSTVEVLGTHFNVNTYNDEDALRVTLLEGSVKTKSEAGSQKYEIIIKPGQQAIQTSDFRLQTSDNVDLEQVMSWKNGLFNFNGADLKTVMQQLSRWYDLDIRYEGQVPARKFRGEITRDLNLSQVLKTLETVEVKFRIEGKTLVVIS